MTLDPLVLSRIQFALTIGFHFLFPPLTIGLVWLLVIVEGLGWKRNDPDFVAAGKFFAKILAITFVVGVASGIVMEFQFGTNWARYSKFVGDIFGAPLAIEAVFAFFLESTFLGVYLFGRDKISKAAHWASCLIVAIGSTLSAFWIIVANSWQQTPAGYVINEAAGRAELTSFSAAVFNESTFIRFFHVFVACLVAGAFLMAGVSAYLILKDRATRIAKKTLAVSLIFGLLASLSTLWPTGHHSAKMVAHLQKEKFAAMEGLVRGQERAPLAVFGVPQDRPPKLEYVIEIPGMLSWMAYGNVNAHVAGLEDLKEDGHPVPPMIPVFVSFHTMVGLGCLFIGLMVAGTFMLWRGWLDPSRWYAKWYLRILILCIPLPLLACEFGWIVTEVGRQPWVVYKLLKTADAFSTNVSGGEILFSIIMFGLIYLFLGILYVYLLVKKVKQGPEVPAEGEA